MQNAYLLYSLSNPRQTIFLPRFIPSIGQGEFDCLYVPQTGRGPEFLTSCHFCWMFIFACYKLLSILIAPFMSATWWIDYFSIIGHLQQRSKWSDVKSIILFLSAAVLDWRWKVLFLKELANPGLFFIYFRFLKHTVQIWQQMKKMSFQLGLNSRPLEPECPPITTRTGLLPGRYFFI